MNGSNWKMPAPCANCPFTETFEGRHLRRSLGRERWQEITDALKHDNHFMCHKTTPHTGDGSNLVCAGALAWQEKRGLSSNYQRVMERLEYFAKANKL